MEPYIIIVNVLKSCWIDGKVTQETLSNTSLFTYLLVKQLGSIKNASDLLIYVGQYWSFFWTVKLAKCNTVIIEKIWLENNYWACRLC